MKIKNALHGRKLPPRSDEWKRKLSEARKGEKHSEETKRKISLKSKDRKMPPRSIETRKKMSEAQKGKKLSPEHKKKLSDIHRGRKLPPVSIETRMKMSESSKKRKRHPLSVEHRKKLSEWHVTHPNNKFKNTNIEMIMKKLLDSLNIKYIYQHPLNKIAVVDFYLPEHGIVIQCDGCYWHNCPTHYPSVIKGKTERDAMQNAKLTTLGYKIYRFWEHDIIHMSVFPINLFSDTLIL